MASIPGYWKLSLVLILCISVVLLCSFFSKYGLISPHRTNEKTFKLNAMPPDKGVMELTVRMTASSGRLVGQFLCMLLRTAALYWDASYGPIHLILDEGDEPLVDKLKADFGNLFSFRASFEKNVDDIKRFADAAVIDSRGVGKNGDCFAFITLA